MIVSLSKFNSRRLSLPSETESKKRSMIKELRVDYRKCFTNSALSSTAKRFSPTTLQTNHCINKENFRDVNRNGMKNLASEVETSVALGARPSALKTVYLLLL